MANVDPERLRKPSALGDEPLAGEALRPLLLFASLAVLLGGALDLGSIVVELVQGADLEMRWAVGLNVGGVLCSVVALFAFWALGEHLGSKGFRVSVLGLYLCSWALMVAGLALVYDFPPPYGHVVIILGLVLLVGVFGAIGVNYPSAGKVLTGLKFLLIVLILALRNASKDTFFNLVPILIATYWGVLLVTLLGLGIWFSLSLIRARGQLGSLSAVLGYAQLGSYLVLLGAGAWALAVSVRPELPDPFPEEAGKQFAERFMWCYVGTQAVVVVLTMAMLWAVRQSPLMLSLLPTSTPAESEEE